MAAKNYTLGTSDDIRQALKSIDEATIANTAAQTYQVDMDAADARATARLRAALPIRYRELLDGKVYGEIVVWNATTGQSTGQLGRPQQNANHLFWLNPGTLDPKHDHAGHSAALVGVSVDAGGAATFPSALAEGDRVVATYTYTCSQAQANVPPLVTDLWSRLAAYFLIEAIYPTGSPTGLLDSRTLSDLKGGLDDELGKLAKPMERGGIGIPEFDDVEFWADHPAGDPLRIEHWGNSEVRL